MIAFNSTPPDDDGIPGPPAHWPPNLRKAFDDRSWMYAVQMRSGMGFVFSGADVADDGGDWVQLLNAKPFNAALTPAETKFHFGRSVDVRLSDIVWVGDSE